MNDHWRSEDGLGRFKRRLNVTVDYLRRALFSAKFWVVYAYLVVEAILLLALAKGFKWI